MSDTLKDGIQRLKEILGSESLVQSVVVDEAAAELKRLRGVEEKLPKTGDNVTVVPGMTLFWTGDGFGDKKRAEVQAGMVRSIHGTRMANVNGSVVSTHSRYSTREAAEQGGG